MPGALAAVADPRSDGFSGALNVVRYLTSHDHERVQHELDLAEWPPDAALRRQQLGAALLLTAPGLPMIWMGTEFGESLPKSLDPQPIRWNLLTKRGPATLRETFARLIALRLATPALTSNTIEILSAQSDPPVLAFQRWTEEGQIVVVAANLRDEQCDAVEIPNWPAEGAWRDVTRNETLTVTGGTWQIDLAPSEVRIFRNGAE